MSSDVSLTEPDWLWAGRIPCLDGFRGVAILMVLIFHLFSRYGHLFPFVIDRLLIRSGMGVDVFFVISGFLITLLMLRERRTSGRISLKDFYLRRGFRILPAYLALAIAVPVLTRPWTGIEPLSAKQWVAVATFLSDCVKQPPVVVHFWTLSIEEHFYLVFPFLFAFSHRLAAGAAAAVVVVTPLIRYPLLRYSNVLPIPNPATWFVTRSDGIAVGCCLAFLITSSYRDNVRVSRGVARVLVTSCVAVLILKTFRFPNRWTMWLALATDDTVDSILIAVIVWCCLSHPLTVGRWLNGRWLRQVGLWSYSIYLGQQPFTIDSRLGPLPLRALCIVPLALGCYYGIELPALRLGGRVRSRLDTTGRSANNPVITSEPSVVASPVPPSVA
jgi:peptidoglycan/LPS O-acetylase OafA/YrhL